ncbi:MAG: PAS domain S-box protein [Nitrospirae bacterium]|nr:PAS domain S-box protein [Nitrospirota bacterium]
MTVLRENPYSHLANALLHAIVEAQSCFIKAENISQSFDGVLDSLLTLTQSRYGFIGEVLHDEDGKRYLQTHAITNIAGNEEPRKLYAQYAPNMKFTHLDNLFGQVLTSGKHVISNHPAADSRRGGLPKGHPALNAFLGLPLYDGRTLVGMAGIANRAGGYDEDFVTFLQPLLAFCGMVIAANQHKQSSRHAIMELRESEAKLQAILDGASSVIYTKNNNGEYQNINRRYEELFNVTREGIQGKTDTEVFPPLMAKEFQFNDRMVQASQKNLIVEENVPHQDGIHTYISNKFPLYTHEGVLFGTCGISTDITDRKRAELALQESESRFRTMADTAPVLIWMSDSEKNCTFVNRGWIDFTGRTLEQELGNGWTENIHPDDVPRCLPICLDAFQTRKPFDMEFRLRHQDGEYRWMVDRGVPRFESDGTFLGFIGTCNDISQQKHLEHAIRRYNQSLLEEVEERTLRIQELEQRRMQVDKLAALSQITAGIAHEINNPLASIQQSLHLVKRIIPMDHPRSKYVHKIDQEIDRIAHIIKQMYQLYQPRHGHPRLVNLNQVTKEAINIISSLRKNKGVQIEQEFMKDLYDLPLPATELHQVLCNILQNAFDAVEDTGIVIVRTAIDSGKAWIQVQDNGPGIASETLAHIFDPFFSTKVSKERNGMGLGLSVSQSLAEAMGGKIHVESTVGKGTTFTIAFFLPIIHNFSHQDEVAVSSQTIAIS